MPPPSTKKDSEIGALGRTYHPGEPLPSPDVVEKSSESAWALFQAIQDGTHQQEFATTAPTGIGGAGAKGLPALKPLTPDEVMFEARRNNRVCPLPSHWFRLYQELREKGAGTPPPPVSVKAWRSTPSLDKRAALRNQVQWCAEHGLLDNLFAFLRDLPEDKWEHMGD